MKDSSTLWWDGIADCARCVSSKSMDIEIHGDACGFFVCGVGWEGKGGRGGGEEKGGKGNVEWGGKGEEGRREEGGAGGRGV